jgi:hypothetical protein
MLDEDLKVDIIEFMEQIDYCLSNEFKEKYRHKYGTHFIELFQSKILQAIKTKKPLKKEVLIKSIVERKKYSRRSVELFFSEIDVEIYYPIIY